MARNKKENDLTITRRGFLKGMLVAASAPTLLRLFPVSAQGAPSQATLLVSAPSDPTTLDPGACAGIICGQFSFMLYDRLIEYGTDEHNNPVLTPSIAKKWTQNSDGSFTFELRDDAVFHDGTPLTAEDVAYSFDRTIAMGQTFAWFLAQDLDIGSTTAVDKFTVKIKPNKPFGPFLQTLATPVASIVNKKLVESNGGVQKGQTNAYVHEHDVGSGPYKLVSWEKNSVITLERNDKYWGQAAFTKDVRRSNVAEPSTIILSLLNGDTDIGKVPPAQVSSLIGKPGVTVKNMPSWNIRYFIFNNAKGVFAGQDEGRVRRQAFSKAFNYDAVIKNVYKGFAERFQGPIPKGMFGAPENPSLYQFDINEADKLLTDSKFPKDHNITVYTVQGQPEDRDTALQLQSDLAKIGLSLNVKVLDYGDFLQRLSNPDSFELMVLGLTPKYNDGDSYVTSMLDPTSNSNGSKQGGDLGYYNNPEVTKLIQEAKTSFDQTKRAQLYDQIVKTTFDDAPYIWIAQLGNVLTFRSDHLQGVIPTYNPISTYSFPTQGKWNLWKKVG